jgi:hypothetical protein
MENNDKKECLQMDKNEPTYLEVELNKNLKIIKEMNGVSIQNTDTAAQKDTN